jgi:beta-N-acetylhexosaminidase
VPFREAIAAGVAFIMTAHILVPSLDENRPATLSPRVVQDILRDELGFSGVVLSDDLEMQAVAKTYAVPDAAVQAVGAGCDGVLICSGDVDIQARALEALVYAVEQNRLPYKRLETAQARQRQAMERFLAVMAGPPRRAHLRQTLGREEHQRIAEEMARFA